MVMTPLLPPHSLPRHSLLCSPDSMQGGLLLEAVKAVKPAEAFDTKKQYVIAVETNDRRYCVCVCVC